MKWKTNLNICISMMLLVLKCYMYLCNLCPFRVEVTMFWPFGNVRSGLLFVEDWRKICSWVSVLLFVSISVLLERVWEKIVIMRCHERGQILLNYCLTLGKLNLKIKARSAQFLFWLNSCLFLFNPVYRSVVSKPLSENLNCWYLHFKFLLLLIWYW